MTSVEKNQERTLMEEPLSSNFDEKRCTRDSKQVSMPLPPLRIESLVLYLPMALQYKRIIETRYGLKMNWVVCWVRLQVLSSCEEVVVHSSRLRIFCMAESHWAGTRL